MNNNEYIIRVYRYSSDGERAYPIADIIVSHPITGSEKRFAKLHGGDFIEYISKDESEEDF